MNRRISADMAVKDLVVKYPQTRPLLEELGIDYCCGGHTPLDKAAEQAGRDVNSILSSLEHALDKSEHADIRDWSNSSLTELADHIEQTHHVFMKKQLPRLAGLLEKSKQAHSERHGDVLKELEQAYIPLKTDIEMHLQKEEQILFPLIRQMEAYERGTGPAPQMHCGSVDNPITQMRHEHDVAGDFLAQMRNATDNYTPPDDACQTFEALYDGLKALEQDLHEHIHLENNILFPRVQTLENRLCREPA